MGLSNGFCSVFLVVPLTCVCVLYSEFPRVSTTFSAGPHSVFQRVSVHIRNVFPGDGCRNFPGARSRLPEKSDRVPDVSMTVFKVVWAGFRAATAGLRRGWVLAGGGMFSEEVSSLDLENVCNRKCGGKQNGSPGYTVE